jgi:hypothetical protein
MWLKQLHFLMVLLHFLGTKKHPIMLGPLLLHYKSDYQTFRTFTDLLESKLNSKIEMLEISGEAILGKLIIQLRRSALHICSKFFKVFWDNQWFGRNQYISK